MVPKPLQLPILGLITSLPLAAYFLVRGSGLGVWAIIVAAICALDLIIYRRRKGIVDDIQRLSPEERAAAIADDPEVEEAFRAITGRPGDVRHWTWIVVDRLSALFLVFGPAALLTIVREGRIAASSPFSFWYLLLMVLGFGAYILLHNWRVAHYRCPRCRAPCEQRATDPIRMACPTCRTLWNLGSTGLGPRPRRAS